MRGALFTIAMACAACGAAATNAVVGSDEWWREAQGDGESLGQRAAYDLACPREQLELKATAGGKTPYASIDVNGCGKNVTYVWNTANSAWDKL